MPVKSITSIEQFNQAMTNPLVVIDFYADWCGPCKAFAPLYDGFSNQTQFKSIVFCKLNVDELPEIAQKLGIKAMPTFMTFYNKTKRTSIQGADKDRFVILLNDLLQIC
jgi:thioredoxin 1